MSITLKMVVQRILWILQISAASNKKNQTSLLYKLKQILTRKCTHVNIQSMGRCALFSDIERISLSFHLMIQKEEPLQTFHSPICCSEDFQSLVCSPFWVPSPDPDLTRLQLGHHCHTLAPGRSLAFISSVELIKRLLGTSAAYEAASSAINKSHTCTTFPSSDKVHCLYDTVLCYC